MRKEIICTSQQADKALRADLDHTTASKARPTTHAVTLLEYWTEQIDPCSGFNLPVIATSTAGADLQLPGHKQTVIKAKLSPQYQYTAISAVGWPDSREDFKLKDTGGEVQSGNAGKSQATTLNITGNNCSLRGTRKQLGEVSFPSLHTSSTFQRHEKVNNHHQKQSAVQIWKHLMLPGPLNLSREV